MKNEILTDYQIITKEYESLGLVANPVLKNYNPDTFGRSLISGKNYRCGVTYAASTDSITKHSKDNL